jgi:hypothetical protein
MGLFTKNRGLQKIRQHCALKEFELMTLRSWSENHLENHF